MVKPAVISHRGANKYAPQNTLAAFEKSVQIGIDGFETDVHITKDEQLVICHNYTIDETSDGEGEISKMTLAQLKGYREQLNRQHKAAPARSKQKGRPKQR